MLRSSDDPNDPQAPHIDVTIDRFSRPVLHFAVALREDQPPTEVFVVHLKSKLPTASTARTGSPPTPTPTSRTPPRSAPVSALQGVSESDAEHLKAAFGITTVADLGSNKFFLWAQAVTKLAE